MEKEFKYVMVCKEDCMVDGEFDIFILAFLEDLIRNHIEVLFCKKNELCIQMRKYAIKPEQSMAIGATDAFLDEAKELHFTVIAFANPDILNQTYQAAMMVVEGFEELDASFANRMFQRKHHIAWEIIRTNRTYIREITVYDLPKLFSLYEQEGITDFIEPLLPYEEELEYTKAYIDNQYWYYGYGMWLIFEKGTNRLIGRAGLENREMAHDIILEMGYVIDSSYQRKGYATEVCEAIVKYVKECLSFDSLHCFIDSQNVPSIRLMDKLGFVKRNEVVIKENKMIDFEKSFKTE